MSQSVFHLVHRFPAQWHAVIGILFVAVLAVELSAFHAFRSAENRLTDLFMKRHAAEYRADPDIVIVDIDDPSMAAMQDIASLWSWPREVHADLASALAEFGPRAIVFDITFSERDLKRPKSDGRLSDALKAAPSVYLSAARMSAALDSSGVPLRDLASAFAIEQAGPQTAVAAIQLPYAIQRDAWRLGLVNSMEDADGVLRRYRLFTDVHGWKLPSLPARVVTDLGIALPAGENFRMRWSLVERKRYPYGELYRLLTEARPTLGADEVRTLDALFRNKIMVIGASATSMFDHHLTPLSTSVSGGYPGVDILAVAIDNLKNGQHVRDASPAWPFMFGVLLIAALAWAFTRRINPLVVGSVLMVVSAMALLVTNAAVSRDLQLPFATPLIFAWTWFVSAAVGGYLRERRSRDEAVSLFGRFLNPSVVREIVDQGATVESLSGRTRDVTVLFSDIRGFTTLSESRPPHEVVALLNRYFERQVEVVFRHGGTLDKFIGDCIMAFWGAPIDDAQHALRAVAAALDMQDALLEFKKELAAEGWDAGSFDVGIGVHSGPAVVGFIGAQRKLDYTAIGDTVNLASRVEGLTKGVARILMTRETVRACQAPGDIDFEFHGAFPVKGRAAAVDLYEPIRKIK
jgi:adenylate cyclase